MLQHLEPGVRDEVLDDVVLLGEDTLDVDAAQASADKPDDAHVVTVVVVHEGLAGEERVILSGLQRVRPGGKAVAAEDAKAQAGASAPTAESAGK